LTAGTATAEPHMRPVLVVVGVAAVVEDAPIAVVAAEGCTSGPAAAGSLEAGSAALGLGHDAVGSFDSSVGVAEDQLRACRLTWS
jgi:hypothetical protein